jgi:DNA (cytosine-5)-methyltransferase 1
MGNTVTLQSIELFTGAGGLALGTHAAGFHHRALFEWNPDACRTLRRNRAANTVRGIRNWGEIVEGDVRAIPDFSTLGSLDLIAGGAPCQPFSIGGKHHGARDKRNMIPEFVRAVRQAKPRAFILENVRGLARKAFASYLSYVTLQLTHPEVLPRPGESWQAHHRRLQEVHTHGRRDGLNYNVVFDVLNAADYGVPQVRERLFVVGFRADMGIDWHFPEPTHSYEALLVDQFVTGRYWDRHDIGRPATAPAFMRRGPYPSSAMRQKRAWRTIRDAIGDLPSPRADRDSINGVTSHRIQLGARLYVGHTGSPCDLPSKTLKAGDHGVPGGENTVVFSNGMFRYLTVRESARIQSFPDEWIFEGAWSEVMRQLGNAVPKELAHVVARSVANALRVHSDRRSSASKRRRGIRPASRQ